MDQSFHEYRSRSITSWCPTINIVDTSDFHDCPTKEKSIQCELALSLSRRKVIGLENKELGRTLELEKQFVIWITKPFPACPESQAIPP